MLKYLQPHAIITFCSPDKKGSGGSIFGNPFLSETWYFNHVSQIFQPGPFLITGRYRHASATLKDQDIKENIVAVIGGYVAGNFGNGDHLDSPHSGTPGRSTELLINGEWTPGK